MGLKGVAAGDEAKTEVVDLITGTLESIVASGFDQTAIDASMNTVEFRLRASSVRSRRSRARGCPCRLLP